MSKLYDAVVEPTHNIYSPMFWLLILDNVGLALSIFTLEDVTKSEYLKAQGPWIVGSLGAILIDGILLLRIGAWRRLYNQLYEKSAYFKKLHAFDERIKEYQDDIDRVEEERDMFEANPYSKSDASQGMDLFRSPQQDRQRRQQEKDWNAEALVRAADAKRRDKEKEKRDAYLQQGKRQPKSKKLLCVGQFLPLIRH